MSLKNLIKDQTIMIDDHKRGSREIKRWDDPSLDVHIDKKTNYPIDGKMQEITIKVPLNSEREIKITNSQSKPLTSIPRVLRKEIKNAFLNTKIRNSFIKDVVHVLNGFSSALKDREKAERAIKKISQHFDLGWPVKQIEQRVNEVLTSYTEVYSDKVGNNFFVTIDEQRIKVGQNSGAVYDEKLQT